MPGIRPAFVAGLAALLLSCHANTGPVALDLTGTYVADSIFCRTSFDTGSEIVPLGASLTLTLRSDSTIAGHLTIPGDWMPNGLPAEHDTLTGSWTVIPGGVHVYGPWSSLLTSVDLTLTADTARTTSIVQGFPLDPFSYRIRLHRL